jgi:hypothetical protein
MKNKLFTALLACTTILSFAQQPSKTELLTHLKNVRNEIQTNLEEIPTDEALKVEWGTENFLFLLNLFSEINTVNQILSTQDMQQKTEEFYLAMFCKMKTLSEITQIFNDRKFALELYEVMHNPEYLKKQEAEIAAIFAKHHQVYCLQYPNGILHDLTVDQIGDPELQLANFAQEGREFFQKLLPKIDAKIKELESQA